VTIYFGRCYLIRFRWWLWLLFVDLFQSPLSRFECNRFECLCVLWFETEAGWNIYILTVDCLLLFSFLLHLIKLWLDLLKVFAFIDELANISERSLQFFNLIIIEYRRFNQLWNISCQRFINNLPTFFHYLYQIFYLMGLCCLKLFFRLISFALVQQN